MQERCCKKKTQSIFADNVLAERLERRLSLRQCLLLFGGFLLENLPLAAGANLADSHFCGVSLDLNSAGVINYSLWFAYYFNFIGFFTRRETICRSFLSLVKKFTYK